MAIVGVKQPYSAFRSFMDSNSMDVPGTNIAVNQIDNFLGNVLPPNPTCKDCSDFKTARLNYICKYRDEGLLLGRYTGQRGNIISTYDETFNNSFMLGYTSKASNSLARGEQLDDSTPVKYMPHKAANKAHFRTARNAIGKIK